MNIRYAGFVALCALGAIVPCVEGVESRNSAKTPAKESFAKALEAECKGDLDARATLLNEAAKADSRSLAHAQQGKLKLRNIWLSIDDAVQKISDQKILQRYELLRDGMDDSVAAHWRMAEACLAMKLPDQARAHMERVLQLDPNFEPARAALGYKKVNGVWVSPEQIAADEAHAAAEAASVAKYGKTMRELLGGLKSKNERQYEKSRDGLMALREPESVLAAEKILSPVNEAIAQVVVDYLANIEDPIATLSLARHAVFYPSADVRREAANRLGKRDLHDYAPPLLSLLSSPIQSGMQPVFNRRGQLMGMRQVFTRAGQDQNQVLVVDNEVVRQAAVTQVVAPRRSLEFAVARAQAARANREAEAITQATMAMESKAREEAVKLQNAQIERTNAVVMQALSTAAGVELPPYAEAWWKWYDDEISVANQGSKYTTTSRIYAQNLMPNYQVSQAEGTQVGGECFVAGTLVTTHRGAMAIEKIKLGDLVLSKNIATGALEFKPVLQTTIRPIEELATLRAGENRFECTRGHFFWVSGRGWLKAEDLKPGMVLHAAEQPVKIDEVCMGGEAETYNLRVADNANYFVGEGRILSHDVTARAPTREIIPGYIAPAGASR